MNHFFIGIVFAAFLLLIGCNAGHYEPVLGEKLIVFYVQLDAETLRPVTSAEMETKGHRCEIQSVNDIRTIKSILDSSINTPSQTFIDKRVRVKLIDSSNSDRQLPAFVEKDGNVRFATGKVGSISQISMNLLKKMIEPQCNK